MALTYSRQLLTGSSNGKLVDIVATTSPGTTIHTVVATTTDGFEEHYIYVVNSATNEAEFTLEFGGTTSEEQIKFTVPPRDGLYQIVPGIALSATSSITRALATATSILHVGGWINRAT